MDLETLHFLISPEGERLLDLAQSLEGTLLQKLTILRKQYTAPVASAAIELLDLRKRASTKFSRASEMFFIREALEQASGEVISNYRAERYEKDSRVIDLACGIGGDTIALASRCFVTAVDIDPIRIEMARKNADVYGLSDRVEFICADVNDIPLSADAAFMDPSRRSDGRRVVRLSELSPSTDFIHRLTTQIPACGIKLSPASDDRDLETLDAEIEFISVSGECREAVAWFGPFKTTAIRATVLPQRASMVQEATPDVPVRTPGKYLFEPDPAIIRAHLVEQLAADIDAGLLNKLIAYLTSDTLVETPFARTYTILDSMPYNPKAVKAKLRELDAGKVIVKKRGVPFDPIEVERKLDVRGTREYILVLTRIGEKPWAMICRSAAPEG